MRFQQDFFAKQSSFNLDQHHYSQSEQFDTLILDEISNPLHLHLVDLE
jgi:ATP:corrinoid adenosyltransferase